MGVVWFMMAVSWQVVRGITLCGLFYLGSNRLNSHADLVGPFTCFPSVAAGGEDQVRPGIGSAPDARSHRGMPGDKPVGSRVQDSERPAKAHSRCGQGSGRSRMLRQRVASPFGQQAELVS